MPTDDRTPIPGGFSLIDGNGRQAPFTFRDFYSAVAFVRLHPFASFTHLERPWRIIREIDGADVTPRKDKP